MKRKTRKRPKSYAETARGPITAVPGALTDFKRGSRKPEKAPASVARMAAPQAYVDPSRLFARSIFLPYNPSVLVTRKGLEIFDRMKKDEQVKMALRFKKLAIISPGWEVVSPEDQEDDWEVTKFVRDCFTHFQDGWDGALKKILRGMDYGYSIAEKIYAMPKNAPAWAEGKAPIVRLNECKPHYFDFDMDEFGSIMALVQHLVAGQADEKRFSPEKFVVYTYNGEHENPYGESDLEAAYRPWWVKDNAYKWFAILLERYGLPPFFLFYNSDSYQSSQVDELKKVVKAIQSATMGILPRAGGKEGLEFWTQQVASGAKDIFIGSLGRFDADIAKAILMPSHIGATTETPDQGSGGSLARSNVHFKNFMLVVTDGQSDVARVVNTQIIPQLCDLNFPDLKAYPEFRLLSADDETETAIFTLWSQLVSGKVVNRIEDDEKHIRAALKFPKNEDIKIESLPEDAKMAADKEARDADREQKGELAEAAAKAKADALKKGPKKVPFEEISAEMRTYAEENDGVWLDVDGHAVCVKKNAEWREEDHPRHPSGSSQGGEFADLNDAADAIAAMDDETRDNTEIGDFPGHAEGFDLYEARKMLDKAKDGKLKRVTELNSFHLWQGWDYITKVGGVIFGVTKYDDPDASEDDDESFVYAYKRLDKKGGMPKETPWGKNHLDEFFKQVKAEGLK